MAELAPNAHKLILSLKIICTDSRKQPEKLGHVAALVRSVVIG